jgi:hypothetical protein
MDASPFYTPVDPRSTCALIKVLIIGVFPLPPFLFPASFSKFFSFCSAKEEKGSQKCRMRCACLIRCAEAGDPDQSIRARAAHGHECTLKQWFVPACSKIFSSEHFWSVQRSSVLNLPETCRDTLICKKLSGRLSWVNPGDGIAAEDDGAIAHGLGACRHGIDRAGDVTPTSTALVGARGQPRRTRAPAPRAYLDAGPTRFRVPSRPGRPAGRWPVASQPLAAAHRSLTKATAHTRPPPSGSGRPPAGLALTTWWKQTRRVSARTTASGTRGPRRAARPLRPPPCYASMPMQRQCQLPWPPIMSCQNARAGIFPLLGRSAAKKVPHDRYSPKTASHATGRRRR